MRAAPARIRDRATAAHAQRVAAHPARWANARRNAHAEPDRPRRWRAARDALWAHVLPYLPAGGRMAVVGAGNADDLPLTRLARRAAHVALFDLDAHAARSARRSEPLRLRRRIAVVELDITAGAADAIAAAARDRAPAPPAGGAAALPGGPYDLVIGDLLYPQLLYRALRDLAIPEPRQRAFLARYGPALTDLVAARLHASAPRGHVTHLHDMLGWWPGHRQPLGAAELLERGAADPHAALAAAGHCSGPHDTDPRAALRRLGRAPEATALWAWPFSADVTYLVCATTAPAALDNQGANLHSGAPS